MQRTRLYEDNGKAASTKGPSSVYRVRETCLRFLQSSDHKLTTPGVNTSCPVRRSTSTRCVTHHAMTWCYINCFVFERMLHKCPVSKHGMVRAALMLSPIKVSLFIMCECEAPSTSLDIHQKPCD